MGGFIGATNLRASKNGVNVGSRSKVNFVEGANVTLTITDDTVNDEIDVTIAATGGGGGGATDTDGLPEGVTNLYFTDERAQDAVGGIFTDSATLDFTYNDTTPSITATVKTNSVTGDMLIDGEISTGKLSDDAVTTSKLSDEAVTFAKIQALTDNRLLGRSAGTDGVIQPIAVGTGLSLSGGTLAATGGTWLNIDGGQANSTYNPSLTIDGGESA